jgi:hypothetical protein
MNRLEKQLSDLEENFGVDQFKLERFAESCAMMAAPTFQAHGIEYGDRIPGLYKLAEMIEELATNTFNQKSWDARTESGRFIVETVDRGEDEKVLRVYLDLGEVNIDELEPAES